MNELVMFALIVFCLLDEAARAHRPRTGRVNPDAPPGGPPDIPRDAVGP